MKNTLNITKLSQPVLVTRIPEHAFVLRRGLLLLEGDWGESRKESSRETMGRGMKRREAVALSLFLSSNPRSFFSKIYALLNTQ